MNIMFIIIKMDKTFEESFNNFFLKLVVLNYKHREGLPHTKEDQRMMRLLNILIPIYNRLEENESISLEDLEVKATTFNPSTKPELDSVEKHNQSDSEDEPDPVGDQQIEKLTEESLKILHDIRTNGWVNVESDSDDGNNTITYLNEPYSVVI
jgi:hypothetical protein